MVCQTSAQGTHHHVGDLRLRLAEFCTGQGVTGRDEDGHSSMGVRKSDHRFQRCLDGRHTLRNACQSCFPSLIHWSAAGLSQNTRLVSADLIPDNKCEVVAVAEHE